MSKPNKKPKGPIDFGRLTDGQRTQMHRVLETGARIGAQQDKAHRAILQAMRDTIDEMLESIDESGLTEDVFRAWTDVATLPNARKIARHPLCPQDVVEVVARRAEKPANTTTQPTQKPGPHAPKTEG